MYLSKLKKEILSFLPVVKARVKGLQHFRFELGYRFVLNSDDVDYGAVVEELLEALEHLSLEVQSLESLFAIPCSLGE